MADETTPTTNTDLANAAKLLAQAERDGLTSIQSALDVLDAELAKVGALPMTVAQSNAKRIAQDIRNTVSYRRNTELPQLILAAG